MRLMLNDNDLVKGLGISYMGNKRKLAPRIVKLIHSLYPDVENFYDLCGGGGSISLIAMQYGYNTTYNDLNTGVVNLMKMLRDKPFDLDSLLNGSKYNDTGWISREEFMENRYKDTARAGYIKTVWSFGNNQKDYLYSAENERVKEHLHNVIVSDDIEHKRLLFEAIGLNLTFEDLPPVSQFNDRRLCVMKLAKTHTNTKVYMENLTRYNQVKAVSSQLQHLTQFNQEANVSVNINKLNISNKSYTDVDIADNSVIYIDPPYKGTQQYAETLDHSELVDYIVNCGKPVFVSGYDYPELEEVGAILVDIIPHRSTLSANANLEVMEKVWLFDNSATKSDLWLFDCLI